MGISETAAAFSKFLKATRLMRLKAGEIGAAPVTKIGGIPWWPAGKPRPHCSRGHAMSFVAQVLLADVPELGSADPGLLSFHYCQRCSSEGGMPQGWGNEIGDPYEGYDLTIFNNWADLTTDGLGVVAKDIEGPQAVLLLDREEAPDSEDCLVIPELREVIKAMPPEEFDQWFADGYQFNEAEHPDSAHVPLSKLGGWPSWVQGVQWPRDFPEEELIFVGQLYPITGQETWCCGRAYLFVQLAASVSRKAKLLLQYT